MKTPVLVRSGHRRSLRSTAAHRRTITTVASRHPDGPPVRMMSSGLDAESAAWVEGLLPGSHDRDDAVARLHDLLLRVARSEVRRRGPQLAVSGPELDDLAHQAAADAVVSVVGKVAEFRGESRFTTWACKFAIFEVSTKIGRHFWRRPAAAINDADWDRLPDRFGLDPAEEAEWRDVVTALRRAVEVELTDHQRRIFVALVMNGVPLDALVADLGSNRNAIYKALFDARRKLRAALVTQGYIEDNLSRQP